MMLGMRVDLTPNLLYCTDLPPCLVVCSECVNARWDCELSKTEKLTDNSGKCDASANMLYVDCLPEHPVTCKVSLQTG